MNSRKLTVHFTNATGYGTILHPNTFPRVLCGGLAGAEMGNEIDGHNGRIITITFDLPDDITPQALSPMGPVPDDKLGMRILWGETAPHLVIPPAESTFQWLGVTRALDMTVPHSTIQTMMNTGHGGHVQPSLLDPTR